MTNLDTLPPAFSRQRRRALHPKTRAPTVPNPLNVYLDGLAPSGRRSMRSLLGRVAVILNYGGPLESLHWHRLRYADVARVRAALLQSDKSINTINATLAALRGVLKAAFLLGHLPADELQRLRAIPRVSGKRLPAGRRLASREVAALLRTCQRDQSALGMRDGALIALMVYAGLRRSEVIGLDRRDYAPRQGMLVIRAGKGRREREMVLPRVAREAMKPWLRWRDPAEGPLFVGLGSDRSLAGRAPTLNRLSSAALYAIVRRRAQDAGIARCSPHDLRRTFITRLLEIGVDLNTTRQLAGHEDLQTTARYDRRALEARHRVLARLRF